MKFCLNMIVKNESARIVKALSSAAQFIDCYAITDTGSTDGTPDIIKDYFKSQRIPGIVSHAPFNNWSQARNAALLAARSIRPRFGWDWSFLFDADMQLVVKDWPQFVKFMEEAEKAGALAIDMEQRGGSLHYANRRLISARATGMYVGVTHEYLDVHSAGIVPTDLAYFTDSQDGANRTNKTERDIRLLLAGLDEEPNNSRYYYYLAQSYKEAGRFEEAKVWYKKRIDAGDWDEEKWSAWLNYAQCHKSLGDEDGFIREMLNAYNFRPCRAETLYELAHHFRMKDDKQNIAALFAEIGMSIPRTKDLLFVNDYVYTSGMAEEFLITGFYNEQKRDKAFKVCSDISLLSNAYETPRRTARHNIYFYIKPLAEDCPSFKWQQIPFQPPENWVAMNPSIAVQGAPGREALYAIVRCVNYRIDENGCYLIRGMADGTVNNSNPIHTRNFLVNLGTDPFGPLITSDEVLPPGNMPCEYPPVIGFEDSRLFTDNDGGLWTSSTVRQIHWDGNCEQVLARIVPNPYTFAWEYTDLKRMLRQPRETEKNWAPIGPRPDKKDEFLWMWRPGVTINDKAEFVHNNPPPKLTTDIISGGSQLVGFGQFYVALVHTAHQIPGSPCRYYYHRWAVYDPKEFKLVAMSKPFVFHDKVIEFAAGLARHPVQKDTLVISYGYKDNEARVATIKEAEVARMIWSLSK